MIDLSKMNECYTKHYLLKEFNKEIITEDEIISLIEELIEEKEEIEEKYNDLQNDLENNYKPISYEEQIGYNRNW